MPTNSSSAMPRSIADFSSRMCRGSRSSAPGTDVRCRASSPTTTFSSAVISPKRRMFWNVRARPSRVIRCCFSPLIDWPSSSTSPLVGL